MFVLKVHCLRSDCRHTTSVIVTVIVMVISAVVAHARCACTHVFVCADFRRVFVLRAAPRARIVGLSFVSVYREQHMRDSAQVALPMQWLVESDAATAWRLHALKRHRGTTELDCGAIPIACNPCRHSNASPGGLKPSNLLGPFSKWGGSGCFRFLC